MEKEKKRIALIVNTLANGGAERVVSNLSLYLYEQYDIDIILNDTDKVGYPYKGELISLGLKPQINKRNLLYQAKLFITRTKRLKELKQKNKYIAAISFSDSANVANILSRKKGVKTILSVHTNITRQSRDFRYKYIVSPLIKYLYNGADSIVAVSDGVADDLICHHGVDRDKITVIYNGCDITSIQSLSKEELTDQEKKWLEGDNIIATVGRLDDSKGQWHLIRALSRIKEHGMHFKLLIMGQGKLKAYLQELVDGLGMSDEVIFCGFCSNPFKILEKADLFVSSSLYEGFPNNLVEALACELPCVSTDFESGAREIIAPNGINTCSDDIGLAEYGVIVPVCDGNHYNYNDPLSEQEILLSRAIEQILQDTTIRHKYKSTAKKRAEELGIEFTSKMWQKCIES